MTDWGQAVWVSLAAGLAWAGLKEASAAGREAADTGSAFDWRQIKWWRLLGRAVAGAGVVLIGLYILSLAGLTTLSS